MDLTPYVGAIQALPTGIQHRIQQAAGSLIGSVAKVPKAWIDEKAQDIRSRAASRRALEKAAVEAAKKAIKSDDEIIRATVEAYLPSAIRKMRNRSGVLYEAGQEFADANAEKSSPKGGDQPLDDDWLNMFARQAEDASSDRMQSLLGKILAGEIRKPGAFSLASLRVVAEMDQEMAEDLQRLAALTMDNAVYLDESWQRGEKFVFASRLDVAGLITSSVEGTITTITIEPSGIHDMWFGDSRVVIKGPPGFKIQIPIMVLTKVGQQLCSLLPRSDPSSFLSDFARRARKASNVPITTEISIRGGPLTPIV